MPEFMQMAFAEAARAAEEGEVPVGAVIVDSNGLVLSRARNNVEQAYDPTGHAEMIAIRLATLARASARLPDCDLYVTLEPCAMCAAAISFARLRRVYYAAYDIKGGACAHGTRFFESASCHHKPEIVGGVDETRASVLLKQFFEERR